MRIRNHSSDLLVAEDIPWLMAGLLFMFIMAFAGAGLFLLFLGEWAGLFLGIFGGGMGFMAMCIFVERLQLVLDARTGTATIRSRTILRHREIVLPLADVKRATMQETLSSRSRGQTRVATRLFRPALVLDDGSGQGEIIHPVTQIYSGGMSAEHLVRRINDWHDSHRGAAA